MCATNPVMSKISIASRTICWQHFWRQLRLVFADARLDTLFLAMPISWKGTLQQYVGRLHRLHDNKRFVQVYDYVDNYVPMLARMYERRLKGYSTIGYVIEQEAPPPHPPSAACP